ncbi:hypothetical protein M3Y99_01742800 [Aphelenchoides fujianensis]|nr:hypothetical protein M3Y99_01742800 [Aphelenchoides fujianensis]
MADKNVQSRELNTRSKLGKSLLPPAEKISECIHVADHDPTMALYRLQEHVHKTAPVLVARKYNGQQLNAALQSACCDLENAVETLDQMKSAGPTFERAHQNLRNCMFFKQQLDYERERAAGTGS